MLASQPTTPPPQDTAQLKVQYYERIDHARIHFYWNDTDTQTAGHVELSNYGWTNTSIDAWALAGMDFYGNQSTTKCGTTNPLPLP